MNRFEQVNETILPEIDIGRKNVPAWNNRAHVTDSKNNGSYHTHYK